MRADIKNTICSIFILHSYFIPLLKKYQVTIFLSFKISITKYTHLFYKQLVLPINIDLMRSRQSNLLINKFQEEALTIIYNDYDSSMILEISNSCSTIHVKNTNFFNIEIYKFLNGLSPLITNDIFQITRKLLLPKKPKVPRF